MSDDKKDFEDEELEDFESFEEDFEEEFDESELTEEEAPGSESFDDQDEFEDEWDDEGDEFDEEGEEFQKEDKKKFPLSANAMIMGGGVIVAILALVFTVMSSSEKTSTKKAEDVAARGVPMQGQKHSIVFGRGEEDEQQQDSAQESGLLQNLSEFDDLSEARPQRMQTPTVIEDAPQMPSAFNNPIKGAAEQAEPDNQAGGAMQAPALDGGGPLLPLPDQEMEQGREAASLDGDFDLDTVDAPQTGRMPERDAAMDRQPLMPGRNSPSNPVSPGRQPESSGTVQTDRVADSQSAGINGDIVGRLSEILDRIDSLEEKVTETSRSAVTEEDMAALQKTVSALEKKVNSMDGRSSAAQDSGSARKPQTTPAPAPAQRKKPAPPPPRKAVEKPAPKWELRATQPGRAWIARSGSSEMRQVDVGDTVDGLGRVTEISYKNGIWVINGTQGKVTQ